LAAAVDALLAWKGREVRIETAAGRVEGILEGIDPTGALRIRGLDGKAHTVFAGDASLRAGNGGPALTAQEPVRGQGLPEPDPHA
ncbi:MAG: hypothetical protein AB1609_14685, partial [Bacillota bacterium]